MFPRVPNYAGTISGSPHKKKIKKAIKGKGLLLGKNSSFNGVPLLGAIWYIKHCPIII